MGSSLRRAVYGSTVPAVPPPPPPGGNQLVQFTAEQVIDSVGVCIHPTYSTYTTATLGLAKIISTMVDLGIRHYRTESYPTISTAYAGFVTDARAAGLKAQLIVDKGWGTNAAGFIAQLAGNWTPAGISGLEGQNEPDNFSTIASAQATQAAVYPAVRADARFAGIPFLTPSMAQYQSYANYGNDGRFDGINLHAYEASFNTMPEGPRLDAWISAARTVFGTAAPLWNTEHGYVNGVGNQSGGTNAWVDEETAGDYLVRMTLWAKFVKGITRSFSYELFDETGKGLREGTFGLVRTDGTPKTSYTIIKNFLGRLRDPGTGTPPTSVSYNFTTTGTDVHVIPISRTDGSFDLAIWRAASIWNSTTSTRVLPAPVTVSFTLPAARQVTSYRPNGGTTTTIAASATAFTVPADGLVTLIRIA